jgi:site-specific DNA-methyltransferase (adenine-specific)
MQTSKTSKKPLKCYNKGEPLAKVEPTVAPIITSKLQKSSATLLKGDCLAHMKSLPNNSVDLIICDLPYGCLTGGGGQEKSRRRFQNGEDTGSRIIQTEGVIAGCSWDVKIDFAEFWREVKRIRKSEHTPCIHFCTTRFGIELIRSNEVEFRTDLVWNKGRGVSFLSANKMPMRSHEMIYVFSKKGANYNRIDDEGKCVKSVIDISNSKARGSHPTSKPIELYKWLIERYSNEGDVVLDPTFGGATSMLACRELNRSYIGCEMNDNFFYNAVSQLLKLK